MGRRGPTLRRVTPRSLSIPGLAIGVFGLLALAYLSVPAVDPDYGWHVANGRHLFDGVLLAGRDVYSWTAPGATWIAHEWLTDGVMAFVHDSLGPTANSVLAGGLATVALLLTIARLRRRGFGVVVGLVVGVIALLDAGTLVSVRPAAVEVFFVALLLWLLDEWRAGAVSGRALTLGVLLVMLIWANTHGSFVLGLGILGASWLGLVSERDPRGRLVLALGLAGAAMTLANPFGLRLWDYVASALSGSRLELITEWAPPNLADRMWWAFAVALGLAGIAGARCLARVARRRPGQGRLDDVIIALALAVAGLLHARHAGVFGIAAAPLIAAGLAWIGARLPPMPRRQVVSRPALNTGLLALIAVMTAAVIWARVGPSNTAAAVRAEYPVDALEAVNELACPAPSQLRLVNDYSWGGWLEMTAPDLPVFIDGRSEVYGDEQVQRYATIFGVRAGWDVALDATGAQVVLARTQSALVTALEGRGWTIVHADEVATLLQRPGVDMFRTPCR